MARNPTAWSTLIFFSVLVGVAEPAQEYVLDREYPVSCGEGTNDL
ncbi:MAG: hypothetical protein R6W83_07025 [Cryobacterium sp.]